LWKVLTKTIQRWGQTVRLGKTDASKDGKTDASKDGAALLDQHSQATGLGGEGSHAQRHVNSANGDDFESNHVSDTGTGTVRQSD